MAESNTAGIDPRFDPRFQRGYTDAAAEASAAPPVSYPPRLRAAAPLPDDDAMVRLLEAMERTAPSRPMERPAGAAMSGGTDDARSAGATDVDPLAPAPEPAPEPESEPGNRHERPWFIAGWLLSAALLAIGTWWVWAVNSDPSYYTGVGTPDEVFRQLGWSLAPAFMQAGALGIPLVTSFAAARQLDRAAALRRAAGTVAVEADRGFWRTPGVVALIGIVAASVIVLTWLVGRVVDAGSFGYGPEPSDDEIMLMAMTQVAGMAIGPLVLAAVGAVLAIILLGARHARRTGSTRARSADG